MKMTRMEVTHKFNIELKKTKKLLLLMTGFLKMLTRQLISSARSMVMTLVLAS